MSDQIALPASSVEVAKAIIATTRKVGTLGKAAVNPHGGYNYVSIDKFYETVARAANENGLNWTLREVQFEVMPGIGKTGAVRISYEVDLLHESGWKIPAFSQVSVIHPIQGAQTVGSAMSYADKIFMRQTFKVATGEKDIDADETDNRALDLGPATKPAPKSRPVSVDIDPPTPANDAPKIEVPGEEGNWDAVEEIFKNFIPSCHTTDQLKDFWGENLKAIEALKENAPDMHRRVVDLFTARKNQLKGRK